MGFLESLWKYLQVSSPWLLLGFFFSGVIHNFVNIASIKKHLGKGIKSIFKAAFFGIPLPLCSCAVIPTAVTLRKQGAGNGSTSAFLISTPESGVDSIAMTYAVMDLPMTILRPIAAFFSAMGAGIAQHYFNAYELPIEKNSSPDKCCHKKKNDVSLPSSGKWNKFKSSMRYAFVDLIDDMALWLAIGILLGAGIDWLVPENWFIGLNDFWGRIIILSIGIPIYICASATTPIAASLIVKGMGPGSALLILLAGPATNSSNIFVLQKYIGKKGVIINVAMIALVALGMSYLVDFIYSYYSLPLDFNISTHQHGSLSDTIGKSLCAVILTGLILKSILVGKIIPALFPRKRET